MKQDWLCCAVGAVLALAGPATAQVVVSGNETKIDLLSGTARAVPDAGPDTLTVIDLGVTPPRVRHIEVPNSVIGPPTNIALTPDERLALVASEALGADALDVTWDRHAAYDEATGPPPWALQYLRSFSNTIAGGTSEIQRNIIAQRVLGLPRS